MPQSDGTPGMLHDDDSQPISSGKVTAVTAGTASEPVRTKRLSEGVKDTLDVGVTKLGSGIEAVGEGITKIGDMSRKVPMVGAGVAKIGEGIASAGAHLHELPRVARTRRGRLLIRSVAVGLALVAAWISVIVALQLRGNDTPDLRPDAERILVDLSKGTIDDVYEQSSPRFQEMVRKERFVDDMADLAATVGKFKEIGAINETLVTSGPTGRVGRVSLTAVYEKATCRASVSLHYTDGKWKLLGIGVELPPEMKITREQREDRIKACKDPMDLKHCDVHAAADAILHELNAGHADKVWDEASQVFQKQEPKAKFVAIQTDHFATLGNYRRIIAVTEAKVIGGTTATFDTLAEFDRASGVRTVFGLFRSSKANPWKLRSFKIVLPMPRAADEPAKPPPVVVPPVTPHRDAGVH